MKFEYVDLRPFFKAKFIACIYRIFATKMKNMPYMCNKKKTCGNAYRWFEKVPFTLHCIKGI